jgi:hypothetical protein
MLITLPIQKFWRWHIKSENKINKADKVQVKNKEVLENILRVLSMLEKAFDRLKRKNWHNPDQYPEFIFEVESLLIFTRKWIADFKAFSDTSTFISRIGVMAEKLGRLIANLISECEPVNGKKREKKSRSNQERSKILDTLSSMAKRIADMVESLKPSENDIGIEMEKALSISFEQHLSKMIMVLKKREPISKRGRKTIIFPWSDADYYLVVVNDRVQFRDSVLRKLSSHGHCYGHHPDCKGEKGYLLKGFRKTPRKTIMKGGEQRTFPIRIIECNGCGERFSLLPSFLPREKHFCIEIIGDILRSICLFSQSIRAAFESSNLTGRKLKSIQTILNWIKWMGFHHPAEILMRAKVKSSGYFQEDEGFEKEPDLRTYSVVMVDSENLLVWHIDYVDHVDEETLCKSFSKFAERIDFKLLGVTKDKWQSSTNALKAVFHQIWIGFCHRHFMKKFLNALYNWEKESKSGVKEVKRIYKKVKKILSTSNSGIALKNRIEMAGEPSFDHPSIGPVLDELKKNAVHYTVNKKRNGIKKTTSLVDNFLKTVKRKLRQVESFRDRKSSTALLRAIANVRNFVPFMSGAKNAHQSSFMMAGGGTFDLPWIQVMNLHNAFLFAK